MNKDFNNHLLLRVLILAKEESKKLLPLLLFLLVLSCTKDEAAYLPKPKGFHRLELPTQQYKPLADSLPYFFEQSVHAEVRPDRKADIHPDWVELYYPKLDAQVSISYHRIKNNFDSLIELSNDSHRLTFKHQVKATAIEEAVLKTDQGYQAFLFALEGDVPSQFQWFITDSTDHFLRAALYFPTSTQNDSLMPVINYMKDDMMHMLQTAHFKEKPKNN